MSQDLINSLMLAAIVGLVTDHIIVRTGVAVLRADLAKFVTAEQMQQLEQRITATVTGRFDTLHAELSTLSNDLAYLKGSLTKQKTGG